MEIKWIPECLVVLVKQRREVNGENKEVTVGNKDRERHDQGQEQ